MTNLPQNDDTKQFIIDHWAAIQPKDISAGWNVSAVEFDGSDTLVTCHSPVPPSPRVVRVSMIRVEMIAALMYYGPFQPENDHEGVPFDELALTTPPADEPEPPAKPARKRK